MRETLASLPFRLLEMLLNDDLDRYTDPPGRRVARFLSRGPYMGAYSY